MKTYAKGGRKNEKEASCGDLKCSFGMTMIPATCMAAEFNSGDTIKNRLWRTWN